MKNYYWYTVTIQFIVEDEQTGKVKKIKENHLTKAISVTDAEASVIKDLEGYMGDYRILKVDESRYTRIILPEGVELNAQ
jgi:hypothetical protein